MPGMFGMDQTGEEYDPVGGSKSKTIDDIVSNPETSKRLDKKLRHDVYDSFEDSGKINSLMNQSVSAWAKEQGFEDHIEFLREIVNTHQNLNVELKHQANTVILMLFKMSQVALIASELGEYVESLRKPRQDDHLPEFTNSEMELADIDIRLRHLFETEGIGDEHVELVAAKQRFNETRPPRNGGKLA